MLWFSILYYTISYGIIFYSSIFDQRVLLFLKWNSFPQKTWRWSITVASSDPQKSSSSSSAWILRDRLHLQRITDDDDDELMMMMRRAQGTRQLESIDHHQDPHGQGHHSPHSAWDRQTSTLSRACHLRLQNLRLPVQFESCYLPDKVKQLSAENIEL